MTPVELEVPSSAVPRLQMKGIKKSFAATTALDGVDLTVEAGSVHALLGENGAGKSTLMKILAGAILPDAGEIWIDGDRYHPTDPQAGRSAGISMIYQELSLAPQLSIMENILLGVEPGRGPWINWKAMRHHATEALRMVGRPELSPDTPVHQLNLADQQLVELARSVAVGCRVLILDEPTSSLAQDDAERLFTLIDRLRSTGISIIYISHFLEEVQRVCDRFTVLRDGRHVASGKPQDQSNHQLAQAMVGRQIEQLYHRSARQPGETILRVDRLVSAQLRQEVSLELRRGEVLGIAGLIGAGRTELMRAIFGLDEVRSGSVRIGYLERAEPQQLWHDAAGMVSEDRKQEGLALRLSIADNMTLPCLNALGPWGTVLPRRQNVATRRWIDQLQIKCLHPQQSIGALSGGNQQKVAIARLLHADVDVLLLDEPTRGIDVGSKAQIYEWIDQLVSCGVAGPRATSRGPKAVLWISSYLPELLGVCDRIAVMSRGRLHPPKPARERQEHEMMLEALGHGDSE